MLSLDVNLPSAWTGDRLMESGTQILVILLVAMVVRWVTRRAIRRVVKRAGEGQVPDALANSRAGALLSDLRPGSGERRKQRAQAMGDLLSSIVGLVIAGVAFVMVLGVVGVPIAPLLTSAGILGVALGFGAQTLVKDYLAGVSMILEDQYGVGDSVDLGEASGTVEAVGLRVTRLRDVNGTVWYVRNGEILRVGNQSQNWARTVLDVTVDYDSDLDEVQSILAEEAESMYREERFTGVIIEEPEVWGVERFDKDGVVVRVVLKTAPLQQWLVARTLRQRVKRRFDKAGIRIPSSAIPAERPAP
ncbi:MULTISPECIES: mechanosensitive ion channel family protein [unclassified Aeromicrobium]|jgi:moderate conductance mechanosensitive channel|uniref:mechanosensitive ion channel family protein n=1 Tax=unclassified Aeromicrobium TaxID=2633570 RepID=UPI0020971327|nr:MULTISPECIES: mechanosensitive ion channel family protein [unclassified Aeromicrobium]MCO7240340.1 mechanosensitive ion channel family protein [Aeromicrobium sp. CnD17-E]MDR6118800.1 small-conductance mechanosensitive channel [Aeromicrobium sp. SORGH_AS_0981]